VPETAASDAAGVVAPPIRGRETVLVIDDEPAVRIFAQRVLERVGFTVLTAANGREGLEEFARRHQEIVAVLVNLTIPQLDGRDVLRELHAVAPDTAVLIMSGYSEHEVSVRLAGTAAVGAFIQKPFHSRELLARMFQLLPGQKGPG
jgi:DNA-binding response OmpR family regulator